jgi:hypothetical protein
MGVSSSVAFSIASPISSVSSSMLPNSEMTVPTASFSDFPAALSSLYFSSMLMSSSFLSRKPSSVLGKAENMVSR